MDKHNNATDQIDLIAGHVRLLADLMLAGPDLQDVDRGAFALVLQDLADRLDRAVETLQDERPALRMAREAQP